MKTITNRNWTFKWSKMGLPGNTNYVAMFSAPHIKTNIIYPYQALNKMLVDKAETTVPHIVMVEALQSFLQEQVYGKTA